MFDVVADAQQDGLIERAADLGGVEVPHLDDIAELRDVLIRRHGHVADGLPDVAAEQADTNAALLIDGRDDRGDGGDELELKLRATAVGAARAVGASQRLNTTPSALRVRRQSSCSALSVASVQQLTHRMCADCSALSIRAVRAW